MEQNLKHLYEFGPFRLDTEERLLLRDGQVVPLTPKAVDLLVTLIGRPEHVWEKEALMKVLWPDTFVEENNLADTIFRLRKALGDGGDGKKFIETVPRRGYRFVAEVRKVQADADIAAAHPGISLPKQDELTAPTPQPEIQSASPIESRRKFGLMVVLTVALTGSIGLAVWWLLFRPAPVMPAVEFVQFTAFPGNERWPSFSPDGNQIAFGWNGEKGDNQDIYVKQTGSETPLQLTTDPAEDTDPVWSPDGHSIAFLRSAAGKSGVSLVPAIGGPERKVAEVFPDPSYQFQRRLSYSPDGKFLAVADKSSAEEPFGIFLLATETGERRRLTSPPASYFGDRNPAFSPDGKWIAISREKDSAISDIYLVPLAGGEAVRLTFENALLQGVAWTPDGRQIVFTSFRAGGPSLWRVSVKGGSPERLGGVGRNAYSVAIAQRGNRLAYMQTVSDSNIWRFEIADVLQRRQPAVNATRRTRLIASTVQDHSPQYSPDGKRIAFTSGRTGNMEIWVCDSEGNRLTQLTNFGGPVAGTPRWSPDGRYIAFDSRPGGNADIFIINPEDRQPRRLTTTDNSEEVRPSWSRDGRWVYFGSNRTESSQIWKMEIAGGQAMQVTRGGGFEGFESADGKYFYYAKGRNIPGLWRVPTAGGEETPVLDAHQAGYWRYWAVTEQGIYVATAVKPEQPLIEFFSFATGQLKLVAKLEKPIPHNVPGLTVSPDGRWLLWSQLDQEGSDIILVENFR
jgi:Tol biopolymer transport system component/DNA-binding winged helix-turn-helix (wHTH) protein